MKICTKCKINQAKSSYCNPCYAKYWREWIAKNPIQRDKKRKRDVKINRRRRATGEANKTEEYRIYREKYPQKVKAQQLLNVAIKSGKMKRSACEKCGAKKVHAHHDDYNKPYKVRWLCPIHHKAVHAKLNRQIK